MKPRLHLLVALAGTAALVSPLRAADPAPAVQARIIAADNPEVADIRQAGETAITRIAYNLVREVNTALAKDGPEAAADICHLKDLPMTKGTVGGMPRITALKLTSLKVRSGNNAPDSADKQVLAYIQDQMNNGDAPASLLIQRVEGPGTPEWRVYKPLGVMPKCLACHGDPAEQSPALRTKLGARYPKDQATGYTAGEWRGVVRVTVAENPAKQP